MRCQFCGTVETVDAKAPLDCCRAETKADSVVLSVDNVAIYSVEEWEHSCPPKGGDKQWKDSYSAKESAKAWFREGHLTLPRELGSLLESHEHFMRFRLGTVTPEVCTRLDEFRQGRNADAIVTGTAGGRRTLIAIEAKAAENFGEQIDARLRSALSGTNVHERINGLAEAVFGRPVLTVDAKLGRLRYQLLHALAATVIEATARRADQAVFAVHYFPNTRRDMDETFEDFRSFVRTLQGEAEISKGRLVRVNIPGSTTISKDMPLFVGWATAPASSL
jgi:Domain of unknown function (DUF6946)